MFEYIRDCKGMTLLEIMLALLVLSIVMTMVSMSLSSTLKVADSVTEQGEMYYRAQVALTRIGEDLTSALLSDDAPFTGEQGEINGERADKLSFASMAHLVFGGEEEMSGPAVISYRVEADEETRELILYRSDTLLRPSEADEDPGDTDEPAGFVLCNGLKSVKFSYVDASGGEVDFWEGSGDGAEDNNEEKTAGSLPAAVTCTLEFPLDAGEEEDASLSFIVSVSVPAGLIRASAE